MSWDGITAKPCVDCGIMTETNVITDPRPRCESCLRSFPRSNYAAGDVNANLEALADKKRAAAKSQRQLERVLWVLAIAMAINLILCLVLTALPWWAPFVSAFVTAYTASNATTARRRRRAANAESDRLRRLIRSN